MSDKQILSQVQSQSHKLPVTFSTSIHAKTLCLSEQLAGTYASVYGTALVRWIGYTFNALHLFNVRMAGDLFSSLRVGKDDTRALARLVRVTMLETQLYTDKKA